MSETIIELRKVRKQYRQGDAQIDAVDDVSLEFARGELAVLAGPSGSGKTTLLNLIGGLDVPTSGQILIEGQDLARIGDTRRAELRLHKIGFVFQAYNLVPVLSAAENVEYPLLLRGGLAPAARESRVREVLEAVGLGALAQRRPAELSGGQQQRVAVARAIVGSPAVVLADEPTANLDANTAIALIDLMAQLNRERGVTFVFSSHDPKVIQRVTRLVQLENGRVCNGDHPSKNAA